MPGYRGLVGENRSAVALRFQPLRKEVRTQEDHIVTRTPRSRKRLHRLHRLTILRRDSVGEDVPAVSKHVDYSLVRYEQLMVSGRTNLTADLRGEQVNLACEIECRSYPSEYLLHQRAVTGWLIGIASVDTSLAVRGHQCVRERRLSARLCSLHRDDGAVPNHEALHSDEQAVQSVHLAVGLHALRRYRGQ